MPWNSVPIDGSRSLTYNGRRLNENYLTLKEDFNKDHHFNEENDDPEKDSKNGRHRIISIKEEPTDPILSSVMDNSIYAKEQDTTNVKRSTLFSKFNDDTTPATFIGKPIKLLAKAFFILKFKSSTTLEVEDSWKDSSFNIEDISIASDNTTVTVTFLNALPTDKYIVIYRNELIDDNKLGLVNGSSYTSTFTTKKVKVKSGLTTYSGKLYLAKENMITVLEI